MKKPKYRRTFIKQWREFRGLSLRGLADRLEHEPGGRTLSHASIDRIEKREQPYSQPIIEAIASALRVEVYDLLEVDPTKEGDVVDFNRVLKTLDDSRRAQALEYLRFLSRK